MADVLNRTTREFRRSVHEPDYPVADWIHNPDMSAVRGYPSRYWVITGDTVALMPIAEREAVDAAEAAAQKEATAAQVNDGVLRAFMLVVLDEINVIRERASMTPRTLEQLRTAIRGKL